jgi:intein/homing endonuclease
MCVRKRNRGPYFPGDPHGRRFYVVLLIKMHVISLPPYNLDMGLKYSVNEQFFETWGKEMAYVLGYLYADGSMENSFYIRGKYVRVTSTDRDRIESIHALLESGHAIAIEKAWGNRKQRYCLRIGNKKLYESLIKRGVTPRKSFTMIFPIVPDQYLGDFTRGYFDGDGCARIDTVRGHPKRLLAIFTSGSRSFLEGLHERLQKAINVTGNGLYKHGSAVGTYQLRYSTRDALKLFLLMYSPALGSKLHLSRKYDIFMRYLRLRDISREDIPLVLKQKGPMVKR